MNKMGLEETEIVLTISLHFVG